MKLIIRQFFIKINPGGKKMNNELDYLWKARKRNAIGLPWTFTVYAFTEDRFFIDTGFLNKNENEVRLYRMLDISLKRSFGQRIFRMGTIHVSSADKNQGEFDIINIKNPEHVKEQLSALIEENREKKHVTNREFMEDNEGMDDEHNF